MIKRYKKQQERKVQYRINERIFAKELRVLATDGTQVGILSREEALQKAREEEVDLVEIAPQATPPVAKLIDYNKFLYQQEKKKREEKRNAKSTETKEVRLGPLMSEHDLGIGIERAREFLEASDKVRFVVKFKGRQIVHPELGHEVLGKAIKALDEISKVEREPKLEGKQIIAILSPERKKNAKTEDTQISS